MPEVTRCAGEGAFSRRPLPLRRGQAKHYTQPMARTCLVTGLS
jgi:hypothetical protein